MLFRSQVAPVDVAKLGKLKSPHEVFSERASLVFKTTQVVRFWDAKRQALVYLSYTDRIIEGSPQNAISAKAPRRRENLPSCITGNLTNPGEGNAAHGRI